MTSDDFRTTHRLSGRFALLSIQGEQNYGTVLSVHDRRDDAVSALYATTEAAGYEPGGMPGRHLWTVAEEPREAGWQVGKRVWYRS